MSKLPKIKHPVFEVVIPSTKQQTTFRPFTVKEEKILLVAQESKDPKQMILAMQQVINNCVTDIDVDRLATFDIEYLLVKIRAKSVDNVSEFTITNPENPSEQIQVAIDLDDLEVTYPENHTNQIKVDDETTIIMRYPTFSEIEKITESATSGDAKHGVIELDVMLSCIDQIISNDVVYNLSDFSDEEIQEFLESINDKALTGIKNFFETMPQLRYEINFTTKEGDVKNLVIQGAKSFFT